MSRPPLCIYHANCADGFGAAWAVRKAFIETEFYPGVYQNPPPDVTDRDVILVDFSYKYDVLVGMMNKANSLLVLDHHKTSAEDLTKLPTVSALSDFVLTTVGVLFDMNRSGAGITWDFFHPTQPRPALIDHLEDRDLWRFKLPRTREIQAAVFSYPYDFAVWDRLMATDVAELAAEGVAIERKHFKDIDELLTVVTRHMRIGGHVVPMANLPYTLTSDAGHKLSLDNPFAGCYWDTPDGRVFSLRSREGGFDVSEIAKQYGGGGHRHAAGFRVAFDNLAQFEP